jgi:NAD(P)-binding Rossmann-like domain
MSENQTTMAPQAEGQAPEFDAIVVGAGFSGLYMLHSLRKQGLSVRVYEQGGGVGGTWYWNRYHGARCDSESVYYMFTDHLNAHDLDVAEPAQEAEDTWVGHHNEVAAATLLLGTDSWWVGANIPGKPRTLYPYVGGVGPFRAICQEVAEKGYEGLVLTRH